MPVCAVITFALLSTIRLARFASEKPAKTTECTAPILAQASWNSWVERVSVRTHSGIALEAQAAAVMQVPMQVSFRQLRHSCTREKVTGGTCRALLLTIVIGIAGIMGKYRVTLSPRPMPKDLRRFAVRLTCDHPGAGDQPPVKRIWVT